MSIGDNIRKIRQAKGLTQAQLAQLLKTTPQILNQYENGNRNPKHETIIKIADALQIPVSDLLPEDTQRGIIDFFSGADAFKQKYSEGISVEGIIDNSENISLRISLKEKLLNIEGIFIEKNKVSK